VPAKDIFAAGLELPCAPFPNHSVAKPLGSEHLGKLICDLVNDVSTGLITVQIDYTIERSEDAQRARTDLDAGQIGWSRCCQRKTQMSKSIFLNLPVKNLAAATRFYTAIGCKENANSTMRQSIEHGR
jgi:hypothetical protein